MTIASLTFRTSVSGLASFTGSKTVEDDGAEIAAPESVPAAQPGTLTVRTSATAGTLTMTNADHGIITGQRIDLFWDGGAAYGLAVGTVAGTSVPFTSAAGDALPSAASAVTAGISTQVAFSVTGNNVTALAAGNNGTARMYVVFDDGADVAPTLVAVSEVYVWDGTGTNPLATKTPTTVWLSHDSTSGAKTGLQVVALRG